LANVDWEKIRIEYITTDTSQSKLAKKYGLPKSTIAQRSLRESWVEKREQFKSKVETKTLAKTANSEANRLARLMETTAKAIDVAVRAFEDDMQFNRYLVERRVKYATADVDTDEEGNARLVAERQWTEEQVFHKTDTKALKDITGVLKDLTGLMRDFYNIPTPAQAEAQRIAAERLELDKRRADADDQTDTELTVNFVGELEKYSE
jgi:hypothetical protein